MLAAVTKYARPEYERRFRIAGVPEGEVVRRVEIRDRYIEGTRLRLRKMGDEHKLTQKIPGPDGGPGLVTTILLDEAEYERFAALPARTLEKTRLSIPPFGVDVFAPPHEGLF